jgi:hypothetical protein
MAKSDLEFEINEEMPIRVGLAQLENMLEHGNYKDLAPLVEDINSYKWILQNELCREYLDWKHSKTHEFRQPRHFKIYLESDLIKK